MPDVQKDIGMGLGQIAPRLFSVVTVIIGIFFIIGYSNITPNPGLGVFLLILGIHGVFTNTKQVGFMRKILAWLSGTAGAVVLIRIAIQLLGRA
jgi:hypothetical protein